MKDSCCRSASNGEARGMPSIPAYIATRIYASILDMLYVCMCGQRLDGLMTNVVIQDSICAHWGRIMLVGTCMYGMWIISAPLFGIRTERDCGNLCLTFDGDV
jgi:hypothetical protein